MFNFSKKLKQQLEAAQGELAHLKQLFAAVNRTMAVIEFTPEGDILDANANFLETMGYRAEDLMGAHHRIFCEPALVNSSEYGRFWSRLRQGESFSGKFKRRRKNGAAVWLEATYSPVTDAAGKVIKIIKIASDITARVDEASYTRNLVSALNRSMAVIEFDMNGNVIDANPAFLSLMGYRLDDIRGSHHRRFCRSDYAASPEYQQFWARLNHGEFFGGQYERVTQDGRSVWLEATYNPVNDEDGKPYRVIKFARDITERVRRHEAEQHSAQTAYRISLDTETLCANGEDVILQAADKMRTLSARVSDSSRQVRNLGDQTQRITSIVNTIKDIADQTNLLALNAAIESARAGETGRGFAVVADEVRKLAERTAGSTKEISSMISEIQTEAQSLVDSMTSSLTDVAQGVDLANDAGAAIEQIRQGAQRVVEVVQQFSATK